MKILQIITLGDSIGGAQIHVLDLAMQLQAQGHDVHVLTGTVGEFNDRLTLSGIANSQVPTLTRAIHPVRDIKCFFELKRLIKAFKPDVVAAHSSKAGIIVRLVCFFLGVPNTFTIHGWSFGLNASRLNDGMFLVIEKIMGFFTCRIIAVAETSYKMGLRHRIVPAEKIVTIHNGVRDFRDNNDSKAHYTEGSCGELKMSSLDINQQNFELENADFELTNEELALNNADYSHTQQRVNWSPKLVQTTDTSQPRSTFRMVMPARFQAPKDHETLIKALKPLKNDDWILELLGDGTETLDRVQALVQENGLADKIIFGGYVTDVGTYLAKADVCILISHSEGFPLSILEAMSLNLPIIASNVGGISEQVIDGYNGYLIQRNDAPVLTEKIRLLMNDPTLRREMGENSRTFYEKEFKLEKMVNKTLAVYQSILK
jgi:glycosyltransferase involved in cell wall biosynthesis